VNDNKGLVSSVGEFLVDFVAVCKARVWGGHLVQKTAEGGGNCAKQRMCISHLQVIKNLVYQDKM